MHGVSCFHTRAAYDAPIIIIKNHGLVSFMSFTKSPIQSEIIIF